MMNHDFELAYDVYGIADPTIPAYTWCILVLNPYMWLG